MDGDSDTERRSRALCSSHHRHAFSADEGLSAPRLTEIVLFCFSKKKKKLEENVFLLLFSGRFCYSAVLVPQQRCSRALYVTLPTPKLGPGAHLPPASRPGLVRTRVWSGFCAPGDLRDPPRSKLLLVCEMCVGMVTPGRRRGGPGGGCRAMEGVPELREKTLTSNFR